MSKIRLAIIRYVSENFDDLLALDLKIARVFGAPAPHTISSYAHLNGPRWWEKLIDRIWFWLFNQKDHCKADYDRVTRK